MCINKTYPRKVSNTHAAFLFFYYTRLDTYFEIREQLAEKRIFFRLDAWSSLNILFQQTEMHVWMCKCQFFDDIIAKKIDC